MSSDIGEKTRAVVLAALMVLSVVAFTTTFAGSAAAAASTVTVNDDGSEGYDSVQAAVNGEGSDTIIEVVDGTYDETVTFDGSESNVTIKASDPANPPEINGGVSIKSSVSDLTIENVELSGVAAADRTFQVAGGSLENVTFDGVTFEGDDTVNSAIYGNSFTGNVTLADVTVANYTVDDWAFININTGSTIDTVEITGSTFQDSTGMIAFGEISNNVTIEDNTFSGIDQDSSETAVAALALGDPALGGSLTASISGNTFSDNFNHVVLGDVDGESIQRVVNSNDFDRTAYDDRLISSSIQNVVDSADSGDTVSVGSGTYNESVSISTANVTLNGPNAGLAGYSDTRGDEATITDKNGRLVIDAKNVTIDGFNLEFDKSAIQSKSGEDNLITNNRFELTGATSDTYAVRVGGGSPGTDVSNNLFTDIVSDDGIQGNNVNGVVVTDPRDTTVANNNFDTVDTGVNAGDKDDPEAGTLVVENNNFANITQYGAVALANGDAGLDADINNNTMESSSIGVGVYAGASDSEIAVTDNNIVDVDTGVNASGISGTVDATSNWWGATDGPSGEGYIGNGASVSGDVNVNPASVDLDSGSIDLNQDFIGTVKDSQNVTLSGSSDASFSFNDSVSVPGDVNGTLTLEIAAEEYVFEDALENGEIAQDVGSGKNGTELSNTTGERNIRVDRYSDGNAVEDAGTVTLVHEVESLDEGFNLKSVPQPAQLYTQDVESTNQWNPSEGSYEGLEPNEGENIDSGTDLHRGLYVEAENDDARLGYSFSTDEVPTPDSVAMGNGWHLVGSNFDIDSEGGSRTLDNDLRNVESVTTEGGPGVTAYDSELSGTIGGDTEINEYETYWVFVDDSQERIIVAPNYDPDER